MTPNQQKRLQKRATETIGTTMELLANLIQMSGAILEGTVETETQYITFTPKPKR
jgi:hypothetical protein